MNLLPQNCQNGNIEVKRKILILNHNISKTIRRRKLKFGENSCWAFTYRLVNREKLDLNTLFNLHCRINTNIELSFCIRAVKIVIYLKITASTKVSINTYKLPKMNKFLT